MSVEAANAATRVDAFVNELRLALATWGALTADSECQEAVAAAVDMATKASAHAAGAKLVLKRLQTALR
eukprot:3322169-Lingulodinium_polyedra.AAC.1